MNRLKLAGKGSAAAAGRAAPQSMEIDQAGAARWNKKRGAYQWRSPAWCKAWALSHGYVLMGKRQR